MITSWLLSKKFGTILTDLVTFAGLIIFFITNLQINSTAWNEFVADFFDDPQKQIIEEILI